MDKIQPLKYVGYNYCHIPEEGATFEDYVRFCKFNLCIANKVLMKDPIWDSYYDEEIVAEYYAHVFSKNEEEANRFISELHLNDSETKSDIYSWLDDMVEQNQKELGDLPEDDEVDFSPNDLGTMDG